LTSVLRRCKRANPVGIPLTEQRVREMACGNMNNTGIGFVLEFYFDGEAAG